MRFSILYVTIDRYPACVTNLVANLASSGVDAGDAEILWADNGSERWEDIFADVRRELGGRLAYARINRENEGVGRSLNQLMLRARGDFVVQLGNDYAMPDGWLQALGDHAESIPSTGMAGIAWSPKHLGPKTIIACGSSSRTVHLATYEKPIFGVKLKTRALLDEIGAFDEKLHPYGLEDSDFHRRATLAGFRNFYVPDLLSRHLGGDLGSTTEYRRLKDLSLRANEAHFATKDYRRFGYYVPWPPKTEAYAR